MNYLKGIFFIMLHLIMNLKTKNCFTGYWEMAILVPLMLNCPMPVYLDQVSVIYIPC